MVISSYILVTNCDRLGFFFLRKHKHEILWKPLLIALYGLIEGFGRDTIEFGKIGIQNHLLISDEQDKVFNTNRNQCCLESFIPHI